jgi:nucleoside-diphosphate-sugar epimerase
VVGVDTGFYEDSFLIPPVKPDIQIIKDIRGITKEYFEGIDAVVHLAALSSDALGAVSPELTEEINLKGTVRIAEMAKEAGVKRFIYSSSQNMYGVTDVSHELTEDEAGPYGETAYAKTKWLSEVELKKLNDENFTVVCMRPSAVFGVSPNLRCDIVFNNLVACAYTTGKIEIKSDGTPWRPVVHVRDVCKAFIAGIEAPVELVSGQSFNVGIPNGNFTVRQLAEEAQLIVPGSDLIFMGEHTNSATYKISFKKILTVLKDYYNPIWNPYLGASELVTFFEDIDFTEEQFRTRMSSRSKILTSKLSDGSL